MENPKVKVLITGPLTYRLLNDKGEHLGHIELSHVNFREAMTMDSKFGKANRLQAERQPLTERFVAYLYGRWPVNPLKPRGAELSLSG